MIKVSLGTTLEILELVILLWVKFKTSNFNTYWVSEDAATATISLILPLAMENKF
jgi:hypothetical protein